ncbi:MAG: hypothetical protein AB1486_16590, partial [Planctomycetota bacterium]
TGDGASAPVGRVSHPLDDISRFQKLSHRIILLDQDCLVSSVTESVPVAGSVANLVSGSVHGFGVGSGRAHGLGPGHG